MVEYIFDVNFLLNVDFVNFKYSHQSRGNTSKHWVSKNYWRKQPMQDYLKDASNGRESSKVVMSKSKSKKTVL